MYKKEKHTVYIALTRPAMLLGMPYAAVFVVFSFVFLVFIMSDYLSSLFLYIPLHFLGAQIFRFEPNFHFLFGQFLRTKGRDRTKKYWKVPSASPFSRRRY